MTKHVSLSEEAYARLKNAERGSEFLSNVALRTVKVPSADLEPLFGVWNGKEYDRIKITVSETRPCTK